MIGKPITGKSFRGCVRYILEKEGATILEAEGVRMQNAKAMIQDFNRQRMLNPGLGKAVGHLVLSWSKEDLAKLSPVIMAEHAKEYMEKMGICNTQYAITQHSDREHPHVHIVYNRIDNNGKTITDKNDYARNIKACKEITLKYGYHLGKGKEQVNRHALRGKEKIRYELYDGIKASVKQSRNWKQFEAALTKKGIGIEYKYRSGTSEIQGISFEKGDYKMKGSAIDKTCSYSKIDTQLKFNHAQHLQQTTIPPHKSLADQLWETIRNEQRQNPEGKEVSYLDLQLGQHKSHDGGDSLLDILLRSEFVPAQSDPVGDAEKRRRKRKQLEQSQQITR